MFAAFAIILKDPVAKDVLKQYQHSKDAQSIYSKLELKARKSARATLDKGKLGEFLTTKRLDHTWRGSHHGFILHWTSQLRLFEEIAPISEHYSNAQKRTYLCNAVKHIDYLHDIETTSELLVT